MPGNTDPIFVRNGDITSVLITAANTSSAGGGTIGTDVFLAYTSDTTNGSFINRLRWIPVATAATTTTATVGRVFISSALSGAVTSATNWLVQEITLPAIAADNASTAVIFFDVTLNIPLPPSYTILVTCHAAPAANTNWRVIAFAGDY